MFLFARAILRWLRLVDGPKIGLDVTRRYTVHHLENGVRKPLLASFGRRPQVGLDVTRRYTVHHLENGVCKPVGFVWSAAASWSRRHEAIHRASPRKRGVQTCWLRLVGGPIGPRRPASLYRHARRIRGTSNAHPRSVNTGIGLLNEIQHPIVGRIRSMKRRTIVGPGVRRRLAFSR